MNWKIYAIGMAAWFLCIMVGLAYEVRRTKKTGEKRMEGLGFWLSIIGFLACLFSNVAESGA